MQFNCGQEGNTKSQETFILPNSLFPIVPFFHNKRGKETMAGILV